MDFNIDVRKKQLESLDQYISSSNDKVQSILDRLGWTTKKVLEEENPIISCSINPSHRISSKTADEHLKKCKIKTPGYGLEDDFLSEACNEASTSSIKLDATKKIEILSEARWNNPLFKPAWNGQDPDPMTSDRLIATYSSDERLAIYNYCIQNTEAPPVPPEFNIFPDDKHEEGRDLTYEELLARERDAKRRRIKYKSVHTNHKSHTEVIKEVIENQMEMYTDWIQIKENPTPPVETCEQNSEQSRTGDVKLGKTPVEDLERPHSSISRHSTHSGSSRRSTSRRLERDGGYRERNGFDRKDNGRKRDVYDSGRNGNYQSRNRDRSEHRKEDSYDRRRRNNSRDKRDRYYNKSNRRH